jgi:hypothetical protein
VRDLTARSEDLPRLIPGGRPGQGSGIGADVLSGGSGDDVINAKDGSKDTIDCGTGSDRVTVDAIDVVSSNCEQVIG